MTIYNFAILMLLFIFNVRRALEMFVSFSGSRMHINIVPYTCTIALWWGDDMSILLCCRLRCCYLIRFNNFRFILPRKCPRPTRRRQRGFPFLTHTLQSAA